MKNAYTRREVLAYLKLIRSLMAICVALAIGFVTMTVLYITKPGAKKDKDTAGGVTSIQSTENAQSQAPTSSDSKKDRDIKNLAKDLESWNLVVANKKNPLPEGFKIETAKIAAAYARDNGMAFDARAVAALNDMCKAAADDGIKLLVISCYRPHTRQEALYANELDKVKSQNPSLSDEQAREKAGTVVAIPGTSEHEVGLAVDFNSVELTFEHTKQFQWLSSHAEEYGFVLRYPKDKEEITGIIYEPWHYRYVGVEHAKKMNELDLCLEEYVEHLKKYK